MLRAPCKNKGSRLDLENDRGIFTCTVLNTILQKLIYNDQYDMIDSNLSDSNIGARKQKNIRNHTFIVNGIINDTIMSKNKNIDIAVLDYRQCFDALSADITINDLYEVGLTNNELNLISECDASSNIAVKTPVGMTQRVDVMKIVAQGEVMSPLKCTVSVDSIASSHAVNLREHLYKYKDLVDIPPLTMVDDTLNICGIDSGLATAHLNAQTNLKKLQYGESKCKKLHIEEEAKSILDLVDTEAGKHLIETTSHDKYLGDILQDNGKNTINIEERVKRGFGAVTQICQLLDDLCLGSFHFECAKVFRDSLLLSTLLSNSDAWYNVTDKEMSSLESVDEMFLRKVLSAHSRTAKELLYLETGNIPIRFILMTRRLTFLHYILNEEESSLIHEVFTAQCNNPVKGDWILTVKENIDELQIQMTFLEIKSMSKDTFKNLVKDNVKTAAFNYLTKVQETHSKSKSIKYKQFELQAYLKSRNKMNIMEKSFIFGARTRMLDLKSNFKIGQSDLICRGCFKAEETQEHLLVCPSLADNSILDTSYFPQYLDLFSDETEKIENIGKFLMTKFNLFKSKNVTKCADNHALLQQPLQNWK